MLWCYQQTDTFIFTRCQQLLECQHVIILNFSPFITEVRLHGQEGIQNFSSVGVRGGALSSKNCIVKL